MKILVVYYSLDGNTRYIAQKIAQGAGGDILELEPEREIPRGNFMKFFWGGRQVITREKPKLKPFYKNPWEYDLIFIGTPVWAWSYAPAIASFFEKVSMKEKKAAFFCCHGGSMGSTLHKMENKLADTEIMGRIDFQEPLRGDKEKIENDIKVWVDGVLKGCGK
jgi:flavodoxin